MTDRPATDTPASGRASDGSAPDRAAIDAILTRWWLGHDRRDRNLLRSCCIDDVRLFIGGTLSAEGVDTVVEMPFAVQPTLPSTSTRPGEEQIATTHTKGQTSYTFVPGGELAHTETYVTAHILVRTGDGTVVMRVRGLRYFDTFHRTGAGWRLAERRHTLDWMYEAAPTVARPLAERDQPPALADLHGQA